MNARVIANDQPIATTTERWFSTEFKMDLVNISDNPEAGKHVRKLINIHAGEPDPLLFQVPPDFQSEGNTATISGSLAPGTAPLCY